MNNLLEYKGLDNGVTWKGTTIKYTNAEVHIYMKKANITPELKTEWLNKLSVEQPGIQFEIKALEDFIK